MLIHSPALRAEKSQAKYAKVLSFLRDETWSSRLILTKVIGQSDASGYKTLEKMISKGWMHKHKPYGLNFYLFGITTAGLMESWEYTTTSPVIKATFQPSKVKPLMVMHYLTTQEVRLRGVNQGWTDWVTGKYALKSLLKKPDALATSPNGVVVNIEIELTIKSLKNYKVILSKFLQDIKQNHYHEVHYIVRDKKFSRSLQRLYNLIQYINVAGHQVQVTEKHKSKVKIFEIENWPPLI